MFKRNSEQRDVNSSLSNLDDSIFIADQYYKRRSMKLNDLTSSFDKTNENKNGRQIEYVPLNIAESRKRSIYKEDHDLQDLEEFLKVQDLKLLKKLFNEAIKKKIDAVYQSSSFDLTESQKKQTESLNKEEYMTAFSVLPFFLTFENDFENLFNKLDSKETGYINFNDFCNHLIVRYKEKEFYESLKTIPFNNALKIKLSAHNRRDITIKLLYIENPWRFINISRRGSIGLWGKKFNFMKKFTINTEDESTYLKNSLWLQDAVLFKENNRMCISTSKRNLRFFKISAEYLNEEFSLYGFEHSLTCLDYAYKKDLNDSYLVAGDSVGSLHIIHFLNPIKSLYDEIYKPMKELLKINIKDDIHLHKKYVRYTCLGSVHSQGIRSIKYISSNHTIITASDDSLNSITISDPEKTKKAYNFSHSKGCVCFDFDLKYHLLVSASTGPTIYLWNLYVPAKPVSRLQGHNTTVISLKIHHDVNYLYSLSADAVLKAWDLKTEQLLQTLYLEFPCDMRLLNLEEFGPNPMVLYSDKNENGILLSCLDYIGILQIGENIKFTKDLPLTHNSPITCMIYCSLFKMVITCTEDSKITFWNLISGRKISTIQNAHDSQEITCCKLDASQRRLFTAANNGTIKCWNVLDGQTIQIFKRVDDKEVTSLTIIEQKKLLISVGWNKKIMTYPIQFDVPPIKAKKLWHGETQHKDDIISSDSFSTLLATGSVDGEINIWNIDTYKFIMCLKNKNENILELTIDKLLFLKHRASTYGYNSSILVSSQSGYLNFFNFNSTECLNGSFYASAFENQSTTSLTSDPLNKILISGDTKGFIYLWDIETYKLTPSCTQEIPNCTKSWRAHDNAVESCEFIHSSNGVFSGELLITASSDWCCRLWTIEGVYIGAFGQELKWNLNNPKTFQEFLSTNINLENEPSNDEENLANDDSNKKEPDLVDDTYLLETYDGSKFNYLSSFKAFKIDECKLYDNTILDTL